MGTRVHRPHVSRRPGRHASRHPDLDRRLGGGGTRPDGTGLQALWFAALIPSLVIGAHVHGIAGVGLGHVVVAGGVVLPAFAWALRRNGFSLHLIGRAVAWPVTGGLCVAVVATIAAHLPLPDLVRLALSGTLGLAVYLTVIRSLWVPVLEARRLKRKALAL